MQVLSLFCPYSSKYSDTWEKFDQELKFKEQLITIAVAVVAALATLPILGLGGMAAFRALTDHYRFAHWKHAPSTVAGQAAFKSDRAAQKKFRGKLTFEQWLVSAWESFPRDDKDNSKVRALLKTIYKQFEKPDMILEAVGKVNQSKRQGLLKISIKVAADFTDTVQFTQLIQVIAKIPEDNRESELQVALPYLEGAASANRVKQVLDKLRGISEKKLQKMTEQLGDLIKQFNDIIDKITLIEIVESNLSDDDSL